MPRDIPASCGRSSAICSRCDVLVSDQLLQFWIGEVLLKTVTRTSTGELRKKHAHGGRPRA
jgi:hypothetical protein